MGDQSIQTANQFEDTPEGLQRRWDLEIGAAEDNLQSYWKDADGCLDRFLGRKPGSGDGQYHLNLYHQNISTEQSVLFGQVPKTDVSREFGDADDDEGRVAGEMLERVLNENSDDEEEGEVEETKDALQDYGIVGLGVQRCRYEIGEEHVLPGKPAITRPQLDPMGQPVLDETGQPAVQVLAPEVPEQVFRPDEKVVVEHVYWKDFLYSPCRSWKKCRWVAFRVEMTRDELVKRFGDIGKQVPLESRGTEKTDTRTDSELKDAWSRASVWEIWHKETKRVLWFVKGFFRVLDVKPDPLKLKRFWPCPKPLFANVTTRNLIPRPGLKISEKLHDEIEEIAKRLRNLVRMARVAWAYNKGFPDLARIFEEADEGEGVGVDGWSTLAEKGGPVGQMQFMPLAEIIEAIKLLAETLQGKIALLYQVEGLSDIVRGQGLGNQTASEAKLKAGFASTRLQSEQDKVASFATQLQRIKAEIISKHFAETTIIDRSNVERTDDAQMAMAGAKFIKSSAWQFRIEVKADSIALRDYAALKTERVETIGALSQVLTAGAPLVQMTPAAGPFVLELGKWLIAATKGSQQIEAVFDRFTSQAEQAAAQKAAQPPQPNPQLQIAQIKAQAETAKAKTDMLGSALDARTKVAEHQMDMQKLSAEVAAEQLKARTEATLNLTRPPMPPGA